jgi:hypothetical protein
MQTFKLYVQAEVGRRDTVGPDSRLHTCISVVPPRHCQFNMYRSTDFYGAAITFQGCGGVNFGHCQFNMYRSTDFYGAAITFQACGGVNFDSRQLLVYIYHTLWRQAPAHM